MRTEEVEREAGSRDEMETGLNPLFLLCFFSLLLWQGRGGAGFVLVLVVVVVVVEKTIRPTRRTRTGTKGVIVYMYCIVCTILHIHLLF